MKKSAWMLRKQFEKTELMVEVIKMYLRGHARTYIADTLKTTRDQVSKYIKEAESLWMSEIVRDMDALKAKELEQINLVQAAAWDQFERSTSPYLEDVKEETDGDKQSTRQRRTRRRGYAKPAFLQIILNCVEKRCKLLGLNEEEVAEQAATKVIEIIVTDRSQVPAIISYDEYQDLDFVEGSVVQDVDSQGGRVDG